MADDITGTTIKVDTHDLDLAIDSLKNAVTGAIKGINTSANDKQSGFETALQKLVERSLEVSSNALRAFHQRSLTTMNGEVLKYQKIINGNLTQIERSKLVTQTEEHGIDFERRDTKVRESQNQLISEQKQAFTDFKSALKQVANRLLTVSGMFDTAKELQDRKNYADYVHSPFKDLITFITLGQTSHDVDEVYLRDAYQNMMKLFEQRHTKDFDKNELIHALSKQPGQEHLIEELKKISDNDPMVFIKLLMQAMSQGKNNKEIDKGIQNNITNDYGTSVFLKDGEIFQTDKNGFNLYDWAKGNASIIDNSLDKNLGVNTNNSIKKADYDATKAASVDQSSPFLNAWNNFLSRAMEQFPDTSKTVLSLAALGSALDDTAKTALQLGGGLLLFKGSLKGLGLIPEAVAGSGLAVRAAGLTPYAVPVVASYLAATTAANTTAKNVNGTLGGVVAPKALTDTEKTEWEKNREQRIEEDSKRNAPYMPTVTQNMNGQALVFDRKANEYKFVDPKTHKETWMGMHSPDMKHAHDEWVANAQKRQEFQDQTGTKLMMRPQGRGLLSGSGTIEYIVVDADGKEIANFGNKLNLSKKDMVNKVSTYHNHNHNHNHNQKQISESRSSTVDVKAIKSSKSEKTEWEKNREQRIEEDSKRNAPYMPTVTQNMNGQALVFDRKANEYKFVDPKTHKETWMGMHSPDMKHAHDEWVANAQKRQEFQDQTGTKLMMRPQGRGLLSGSGTIEYIVVDVDGKEVANFGNKLNLSKKDMVNKVSTYYNHNQKQIPESRLPIIDVSTARSSPVFSKNIVNNKPNIPSNIDQIRNQNQLKSQVLNQSSSVKNDQHFNFNIHLTALTNDLSPLKQWFKREFPAIANSVHAPVTLHPHFMQDIKTGK